MLSLLAIENLFNSQVSYHKKTASNQTTSIWLLEDNIKT